MDARARGRSIREVERQVEQLVAKGWRVERIQHVDEPDQPFRTEVRIAKDGTRSTDVPL